MRIKDFPGFIFLCGGPTSSPPNNRPYLSLRHRLLDHIASSDIDIGAPIIVAESFGEWLQFDTYTDLMAFERHLAGVANVIPIILEGPGAIAELGAFSQESNIKEKLLIFRQEKFATHQSFINFGLIKFIENEDSNSIQTYPWHDEPDDDANADIVADIANDIKSRAQGNLKKTSKFQPDNPGHVMILIEDFLKLMIGLKVGEIVKFLNEIHIPIDEKTAKQYFCFY